MDRLNKIQVALEGMWLASRCFVFGHDYRDGVSSSSMPIRDSEGKLYRETTRFQSCQICGDSREIEAHEYSGGRKKILAVRHYPKRSHS